MMRSIVAFALLLTNGAVLASPSGGAEAPPGMETLVKRLQSGEPTRIVCFGDSITGAYYHTGGQRAWCDMLGIALSRIYPQANIESINAGISGQTTAQGLARIQKDVLSKQPHLVVVMFGMNDVARLPLEDFAANLRSIAEQCRLAGAAVVLCTPNSVYENSARPNAKLAALSERVRQLAKEQSLPVADCFADYQERRTKDETAWMLLMSDEIHPNMHGHCRFAELMAETITGQRRELNRVPPPADALHHTLARLEQGDAVHLVAMPPYDDLMAAALRRRFPQAEIKVTVWPTEGKTLGELRQWAAGIRELKPDLVVPAVPAAITAADAGSYIRDYEWVLNFSFPFAGRAWDIVPALPDTSPPRERGANASPPRKQDDFAALARRIVRGKDVRFLERPAGDTRDAPAILDAWIAEQNETRLAAWPALPAVNGAVELPAQEWPRRPGPRQVKVLVHYPGGKLENVQPATGAMLTLHNWGGEDCAGTADPQTLADRLNVVALCVNYLQSGKQDAIDGPEPYDFGYLQALDAVRAMWWLQARLRAANRPFNGGRTFATGGSGGGNVSLMSNKLAPRTLACLVDMCGMKKLSADIAFNLPGGSGLNARWSRDPANGSFLSADEQDLRFVGHPDHLQTMKSLGTTCRIVAVHGVDDATCPFADAQEMVMNLERAGLPVEPHFIERADLDGQIFTSSGHALGNRTQIVFKVAEQYLSADGPHALARRGPSDFERRDEEVRYQTPGGQFVISYAAGFPVGRFDPVPQPQSYEDHNDLGYYLDEAGARQSVRTAGDWQIRRRHVVEHLQRVMGRLPGASMRVPLDVKTLEETSDGGFLRRKISFQSDPFDRVTAWLLVPQPATVGNALRGVPKDSVGNALRGVPVVGQQRPAILCLHQTTSHGKDEPAGLAGSPNMHYGRELAERGYVVLTPDYPSLGEHTYDFARHPEFASGSMKAIWDNVRAVDLLSSLPEVDPQRIGAIGHSLGGHNALFTVVFEPRLKVVVTSCGFTSLAKDDLPSWTGPRYMPRIASEFGNDIRKLPFDFAEIVGALAPRPLLVCAAEQDSDFDVTGVRNVLMAARPVYKIVGKAENLQAIYPDTPHDFPADARQRAHAFFDEHLK